ncbi:immunity 8 family protein [Paraburkholderia fungorum]|mgnify:CR=1 FL=1|uniref:immunity 8 family protein n=1 Tax=Paraburkholderia fungorum TaxID=134537 RepID=UPI00248EB117|nr:immunity 8 family protein [Paraburkholderia fungorum]
MKAELRKLHSLEIEEELIHYKPAMPENFGTWIRFSVGPSGELGTDNFDLFVCTPLWLSESLETEPGARWGRHLLIVKEFNVAAITNEIERLVQRCSSVDWQSTALKIGRFAAWEFEDYTM